MERRKLAAGDYALLDGEHVVAVVERKTFDNLLTDLGALQALHQQLDDLASRGSAALVIEAQRSDPSGPRVGDRSDRPGDYPPSSPATTSTRADPSA